MRLATSLCERGQIVGANDKPERIDEVVLFDRVAADLQGADPRLTSLAGDVCDSADLSRAIAGGVDSVFHLAAVVSGQAEQDFDLGMRVNVDAARLLLEALRQAGGCPRVVFTSSVAVYGGKLPELVTDETAQLPQSSYGAQKAIGELLLQDFSRKGFVDGRIARLPTITVRPGRPNQAASSFVSSIIREPINGERACCPVNPSTAIWVSSPEAAIANIVQLHDLDRLALGRNRAVNLPGLSVTAQQMVDALRATCGQACADRVDWAYEQRIQDIVGTWPKAWDTQRGLSLGMQADAGITALIQQYTRSLG
jgi:nucleoside-diphosphate-sugar epimerase